MCAKSRDFPDEPVGDPMDIEMSDADLESLLFGGGAGAGSALSPDQLEPGARLSGMVIDTKGGDVLVELDQKTHGLIEESEFAGDDDLPAIGTTLEAQFVRHDKRRDLVILSVSGARREIFWEELRPGLLVEGVVAATNKGGLSIDIKGHRAFLPISQIELHRVEDLEPYVGRKLTCEVTQIDASEQNIVLSRRNILEREAEEIRGKALERLQEGEVLTGTVTRVNQHGAFVDLGGVEGLLHTNKIHRWQKEIAGGSEPSIGQQIEVEITRIDAGLGRVGLDFHRKVADSWDETVEGWTVGDEVTGWVSRVSPEGIWVSIDEGVEGLLSSDPGSAPPAQGSVLRARIRSIDISSRRIELDPV